MRLNISLLFSFLLLLITNSVNGQQVYNIYIGEIYEGGELVSKGDQVGNKVTIDEKTSKITTSTKDGYKNQIFRIVEKIPGDKKEVTIYECEGRNNNGTYTIYIFVDTFYQTIDYHSAQDIRNKTGRYIRQYCK